MAETVSLRAILRGRVQGVFMRSYVQARADHLDLTGFVRNLADGTVEVWAEGERGQMEKFAEFLYVGSPSARVDAVDTVWGDATGRYTDFRITR